MSPQQSPDSWAGETPWLQLTCGDQRGRAGPCRQTALGKWQWGTPPPVEAALGK